MKTRGIQNAINRLGGARRLGSPSLMAQAEREASHILTQAHAWLARTPAPPEGEADQRYTPVALAVVQLEQALSQAQQPLILETK